MSTTLSTVEADLRYVEHLCRRAKIADVVVTSIRRRRLGNYTTYFTFLYVLLKKKITRTHIIPKTFKRYEKIQACGR